MPLILIDSYFVILTIPYYNHLIQKGTFVHPQYVILLFVLYWTVNGDIISPNNAEERVKHVIIQCTFELSFVLKVNRHQGDFHALPPASGLPLAGPLYTSACLGLGGGQLPSLSLTPITLTTVLGKARASLTLSCMGMFELGPLAGWLYSAWVCSHLLETTQAKRYALASPFFSIVEYALFWASKKPNHIVLKKTGEHPLEKTAKCWSSSLFSSEIEWRGRQRRFKGIILPQNKKTILYVLILVSDQICKLFFFFFPLWNTKEEFLKTWLFSIKTTSVHIQI